MAAVIPSVGASGWQNKRTGAASEVLTSRRRVRGVAKAVEPLPRVSSAVNQPEVDGSAFHGKAVDFRALLEASHLTAKHLGCFACEAGRYPKSVEELESYKSKGACCAELLTAEPFDFLQLNFKNFKITMKDWGETVTFVLSENGVEYEALADLKKEPYKSMSIYKSELECNSSSKK